jgi:hypothetical protein
MSDDVEKKHKPEKKINNLKEKIRKAFKRIALVGMLSVSVLTPTYPAVMFAIVPHNVPGYEYEMNLIRHGDKLAQEGSEKDFVYYKMAVDSIKQKQDKIGEGKDMNLDWMRAYTVYSTARSPPSPEDAERYLLEAKELARKYYEIWKNDIFLFLYTKILENLGDIYFNAAENVRNGKRAVIKLKSVFTSSAGFETNTLVVDPSELQYFVKSYKYEKIITRENFTELLDYYKMAKRYYEEYFRFCEDSENVKEMIKRIPKIAKDYEEINNITSTNLKIIDEILSKYQQKESSKEEKKEEIAEKKNNNNKQEVKEEKKEESKTKELIGKDWK